MRRLGDKPQAVADRSVGLSMQMTQVKVLKVVVGSDGGCGRVRLAFSIAVASGRTGWGLGRLVEGPGEEAWRFLERGGESGMAVRST